MRANRVFLLMVALTVIAFTGACATAPTANTNTATSTTPIACDGALCRDVKITHTEMRHAVIEDASHGSVDITLKNTGKHARSLAMQLEVVDSSGVVREQTSAVSLSIGAHKTHTVTLWRPLARDEQLVVRLRTPDGVTG